MESPMTFFENEQNAFKFHAPSNGTVQNATKATQRMLIKGLPLVPGIILVTLLLFLIVMMTSVGICMVARTLCEICSSRNRQVIASSSGQDPNANRDRFSSPNRIVSPSPTPQPASPSPSPSPRTPEIASTLPYRHTTQATRTHLTPMFSESVALGARTVQTRENIIRNILVQK